MENQNDVVEVVAPVVKPFTMSLIEKDENNVLKLDQIVRETAINVKDGELDKAVFVKASQMVQGRGRDADMVPAKWLPEPIKPFCENPCAVPVPSTIGAVKLFRPLDMEKVRNGDPKGQALFIFVSSVPQAYGPDTQKPYMIGVEPTEDVSVISAPVSHQRKISEMILNC